LSDRTVLCAITLWFGAGVWVLLGGLLAARWAYHRDRFEREARSPGAFTGITAINLRSAHDPGRHAYRDFVSDPSRHRHLGRLYEPGEIESFEGMITEDLSRSSSPSGMRGRSAVTGR